MTASDRHFLYKETEFPHRRSLKDSGSSSSESWSSILSTIVLLGCKLCDWLSQSNSFIFLIWNRFGFNCSMFWKIVWVRRRSMCPCPGGWQHILFQNYPIHGSIHLPSFCFDHLDSAYHESGNLIMMLPPSNLPVCIVFLGSHAVRFFFIQTWHIILLNIDFCLVWPHHIFPITYSTGLQHFSAQGPTLLTS